MARAHGADQAAAAQEMGPLPGKQLALSNYGRPILARLTAPRGCGPGPRGGAGGSAACRPPAPIGVRPRLITSRNHSCVLANRRGPKGRTPVMPRASAHVSPTGGSTAGPARPRN